MGQMTFALMWGCPMPKAPRGKRWHGGGETVKGTWVYQKGILDLYKPEHGQKRPDTDYADASPTLGFYIAAGASGMDGIPYLHGPIDLASIEQNRLYTKSLAKARVSWEHFAAFCLTQGIALDTPRLWLVETEVA